jgi:hypothetical protein
MDNYKTIERKLAKSEAFKGNSMSAYWFGNTYVVYSYNTLIASTDLNGYEFDGRKYSTTTSRHQNLIRRVWGVK